MKMIRQVVQLTDVPFEEMSFEDLIQEQKVHKWHRSQMKHHIERLKKKEWWLNENQPILTKEEIKEQYENGEITQKQFKTAFARRTRAIKARLNLSDYMNYAHKVVENEDALVTYLEELAEQRKLEKDAVEYQKKHPPNKAYDPRLPISATNRPPWQKQLEPRKVPRLNRTKNRWRRYKEQDRTAKDYSDALQPITSWDAETLKSVARDRGFFSDVAVIVTISEALDISTFLARRLLSNGKFSWGQCIAIGALFEMSPKEFCDTFLQGYFREIADGVYKAHIDDIPAFVANAKKKNVPKGTRVDAEVAVGEVIIEEEDEEDDE